MPMVKANTVTIGDRIISLEWWIAHRGQTSKLWVTAVRAYDPDREVILRTQTVEVATARGNLITLKFYHLEKLAADELRVLHEMGV